MGVTVRQLADHRNDQKDNQRGYDNTNTNQQIRTAYIRQDSLKTS